MRRIALAAVLAATMAPAAAEATHDRTDRIPAAVAPDDFRGYYVNDVDNLPSEVSSARWLAVARRTLDRYGATYLGTTRASADDGDDGVNVIGFSVLLPSGVAGRNTKIKGGYLVTQPGGRSCQSAPNMVTTQAVATVQRPVRLRLRSDRVRRGKVRKRTITVTRTIPEPRLDSAPVSGQRCVNVTPATESDPARVVHESDVQMDSTSGVLWHPGPGAVPGDRIDLETVLIHELGHSAGLAHQPQNCDPSTPMRPSGTTGDFWRGLDEVAYADCPSFTVTPDATHGAEAPFAGGSLGGRAFHVNPAVPGGYDSARFVAVARSALERWGGTFAGLTDAKPAQGDGVNVIGFDAIARTDFEVTTRTSVEELIFPAFRTCTIVQGQVPRYRVKKAFRKVRVNGKRRKLRRDRVVRSTVSGPASGQCADRPGEARAGATTVETDVAVAHEMDAYEMGPTHPVLETKVDMATLLASALGRAAGVAPVDRCASDTPVTLTLEPGDWWHSPADLKRVGCAGGRSAAQAPAGGATRDEPANGPVRYVLTQE